MSDGNAIKINMSFGVATLVENDPISAEKLVKRADHALYQAKAGGRNRCCSYQNAKRFNSY
jgi:diguanylate cyclase (GGDEF)-like protein